MTPEEKKEAERVSLLAEPILRFFNMAMHLKLVSIPTRYSLFRVKSVMGFISRHKKS